MACAKRIPYSVLLSCSIFLFPIPPAWSADPIPYPSSLVCRSYSLSLQVCRSYSLSLQLGLQILFPIPPAWSADPVPYPSNLACRSYFLSLQLGLQILFLIPPAWSANPIPSPSSLVYRSHSLSCCIRPVLQGLLSSDHTSITVLHTRLICHRSSHIPSDT